MHANHLQELTIILQGAQIERLNQQLTQSKSYFYSTDSLELSSSTLIKDQSMAKSKYHKALQEIQKLQDTITTITQQKVAITSQLNLQLKEYKRNHQKQLQQLEQQLRGRTQQYKYIIDSKQAQIRTLDHKLQQLEKKYHQLQTKVQSSQKIFHEQLLNTLTERDQRILNLEGELQKLKKMKYQQTVEELSEAMKLLEQNKLQEKNKQHFKIRINQILSRLDRIIATQQKQVKCHRREIAALEDKIKFLSGDLPNKQKVITFLKEENFRLKSLLHLHETQYYVNHQFKIQKLERGSLHKLRYKFSQ